MLSEEMLKEFKAGNVAFNCPTQEIYDKLMIELEKLGYTWCDGAAPTEGNEWASYREKFCISNGSDYGLTFESIKFCDNIEVIQEDDFSNLSEAQQDLETLRSLFLKYNVCIAENLEKAIEKAAGITKEETKTIVRLPDGIYTK